MGYDGNWSGGDWLANLGGIDHTQLDVHFSVNRSATFDVRTPDVACSGGLSTLTAIRHRL
jgi:hypothetical protein